MEPQHPEVRKKRARPNGIMFPEQAAGDVRYCPAGRKLRCGKFWMV